MEILPKPKCVPVELNTTQHRGTSLPDELWLYVTECQCSFPPDLFSQVMLNLIRNPNITSSHLFRADILYDSDQDHGLRNDYGHMKAEYRPIDAEWPEFRKERTIVRQLIPRNPQLDKALVQTCHFYSRKVEGGEDTGDEQNLVLYIPHVQSPEEMPFYHPAVSRLAFLHTWHDSAPSIAPSGTLTILYRTFPRKALDNKLSRTALRLLQTIHKHGQGQLAGYEKRVHHDQLIPQKRYQDTYTSLKVKYGKQLADQWVEVTDPGKHVFEDIGIAAFLIELWRDMYVCDVGSAQADESRGSNKPPFPGFVDIGCGNGILAHILISEGYEGWGFDARERKTWSIFPATTRERLQRRILVPSVFQPDGASESSPVPDLWHDGMFAKGAFIVSNHADELTAWTPLLAYLSGSSFIAIPCCSHDLSGARFRAPSTTRAARNVLKSNAGAARLPQQPQEQPQTATTSSPETSTHGQQTRGQAAETGSLKRTEAQAKMPSAYSTLCSYVTSLGKEVGFVTEQEVLRIPSTRNQCIFGRQRVLSDHSTRMDDSHEPSTEDGGLAQRKEKVSKIVESELNGSIADISARWIQRAEQLTSKPGSGH